ncbi:transcription factor BIM2 [Trifolium medium]|nr:transcription factor BIM2 [Trifolium medium]
MKAGKLNHDEDEYDDDDFNSSKKQGTSSAPNTNKDGKATDKASVIRSKHSVTEQRRRSKINESTDTDMNTRHDTVSDTGHA